MTSRLENTGKPPGIPMADLLIVKYAATDVTHRPLAERIADPDYVALSQVRGIQMGFVDTTHTDSREGTRMNIAALEALGGKTREMLDGYGWLRQQYFKRNGPPSILRDDDVRGLASLGESLPSYLMLRAENPVSREELPEVVGNIFKTTMGFGMVARHNIRFNKRQSYDTAEEIFNVANNNSILISNDEPQDTDPRRFSCPANKELIIKSADALLFGIGTQPERSVINELIPEHEIDNFLAFSRLQTEYDDNTSMLERGESTRLRFYNRMIELQQKINLALGRDPDSAPMPVFDDVIALEDGATNIRKGSILSTVLDEVHTELYPPQPEVMSLQLKPIEKHSNSSKKKKKKKK